YIRSLVRRKQMRPMQDLLSALVAVREGDDRLSDHELTSMVFLLLTAGHETTVNLIGNTLLGLLTHPGQLDRLQADPGLVPAAARRWPGSREPSRSPRCSPGSPACGWPRPPGNSAGG